MRTTVVTMLITVLFGLLLTGTAQASPTHDVGPFASYEDCQFNAELWESTGPGWWAGHCVQRSDGWYFLGRH